MTLVQPSPRSVVSSIEVRASGASDDSARLNAILSAPALGTTRRVALTGAFAISSTLVVYSNTVLDLTRATITLNAGHAVRMIESHATSGTGRDSNITIIGGTIDRGANGGTLNGVSVCMRKVDGVVLRDMTFRSTNGKFSVLFQNVTNFTAENLFMNSTASDGVHMQGPTSQGLIRNIRGVCGDDMVAIVPLDYPGYTWGDEGDITDILIDGVYGNATNKSLVKISGSPTLKTANITARNIFGSSATGWPVMAGDDTSQTNTTGGTFDNIVIENVSAKALSGGFAPIFLNASVGKRFRVNGQHYDVGAVSGAAILLGSNAAIDSLVVSHLTVVNGATNVGAIRVQGSVDNLVINGVVGAFVAGASLVQIDDGTSTACIRRLSIANVAASWATASGSLVRAVTSGHALTTMQLSNINCVAGPAWIGDLDTVTTIYLTGVSVGAGLFSVRAQSALTVYGEGVVSNFSASIVAGGTMRAKSLGFAVDASKLVKTANDMATNTNAGLSCGVGPIICDGTNWKHLFTGATY